MKHNYEVHLVVKVKTPHEEPEHAMSDISFALMSLPIVEDVSIEGVIDKDSGVPFSL